MREGDDDLDEDEERVDMSAINGAKEREERREKFYSVQQECMLLVHPTLPRDAIQFFFSMFLIVLLQLKGNILFVFFA